MLVSYLLNVIKGHYVIIYLVLSNVSLVTSLMLYRRTSSSEISGSFSSFFSLAGAPQGMMLVLSDVVWMLSGPRSNWLPSDGFCDAVSSPQFQPHKHRSSLGLMMMESDLANAKTTKHVKCKHALELSFHCPFHESYLGTRNYQTRHCNFITV